MPYPFQVTFRPDGTDITTTLWVDDRQEIANAISPEYCNDWSANVFQMRETADPGDVGSESLAVDLAGELRRLRFKIKQIADRLNGAPVAQWYSSFPGDLAVADGGTGASDAAGARANLGLGTMSTQNANAVDITGGTVGNVIVLAKQGDGGVGNPNNAGYVFSGDNDTGLFEAAAGGPIDLYIDGVKKYSFGGTFLDLLTGQIKFPAAQLASTDPNTLDDYEEGSWTPYHGRFGANPVLSYGYRNGRYLKIGRLVFAAFETNITSVSSQGSGIWYIGGLPFPVDSSPENAVGGGLFHLSSAFSTKISHINANNSGGFRIVDSSSGSLDGTSTISTGLHSGFCVYFTFS